MAHLKSKLAPIGPKKAAPKATKAAPISRVSISEGCGPKSTERSVSIRKIENGYVVRESIYGPKGYKETETFSKTAPKIDVAAMAKSKR